MASRWRRALSTVTHALTRILSAPPPPPARPRRSGLPKPARPTPTLPTRPSPPVRPRPTLGAALPPTAGGPRPPIRVLTTQGQQFLPSLSDREATAVGRHWNAVRRYLEFGDDWDLAEFEGVMVGGYELETRANAIEWHAIRGDVRFESIYDEVI